MPYQYSRWDGSQDPFGPDADDLMKAISDELIDDGDLWRALRRLMRHGDQGRLDNRFEGLQQLIERLRQARQQHLDRGNLSSILDDIKERLDKIVESERAGIQRRLDEAAPGEPPTDQPSGEPQPSPEASAPGEPAEPPSDNPDPQYSVLSTQYSPKRMLENIAGRKQRFLDELPPDVGGKIKALSDYEFMDDEARRQFQELLQMLQQQLLQQHFQGLQQGIQNLTPEDLSRVRNMVRDLNRMLRERAAGGEPDFQGFMQQYGDMFPPGIENLDQLAQHLQRQAAQMQSLLESMTPEMRQQLQEMMDALLRDDRLRWEMAELAASLNQLYPQPGRPPRYPFGGDEPLTFAEAMAMMDQLQQLDELERDLRSVGDPRDLEKVDPEKVRDLLGDEAAGILDQLRQMTKLLEEAGYIQRKGKRWELTPRGIRKIGQKALQDIFARLARDRFGNHEADHRGSGGDRVDETKAYEFGDPFLLDLERTLMNSVRRNGAGTPIGLQPGDFEVYRTEYQTQSSTVLMVDMSYSMWLRGCFAAAKKVAIALNSLIKSQFPRDNLYVLVFASLARQIKPEELPQLTSDDYVKGTNMHHGFMLARQLLARHKGGNRQIILITDGEPTTHLEHGRPLFAYPPSDRTIAETLREVLRCTREGITINTFMLESGFYLVDFVGKMTAINKGRAFYSSPDQLGEYILVDYVSSKRKVVR